MTTERRLTVAVDAMGGDFAPGEIVGGALLALQQHLDLSILLVGDEARVRAELGPESRNERVAIVHASEVIEMNEAASAVRRKRGSSIMRAMDQVKEGAAQAVVAAGSTGAAMSAALLRWGRIQGIERPAIAAVLPTVKGPCVVLDVGANVDCRPEWLVQFALMGAAYSHKVLKVETPRVGLLNIGEEPEKGDDLSLATHRRLAELDPGRHQHQTSLPWRFVGNVEGRAIWEQPADVVVADGFVGNTVLKTAEGVAGMVSRMLREEIHRGGLSAKFGALLMTGAFKALRRRIDPAEYGGALLLGVDGVCVISHGSSRAPAVANAIRVAMEALKTDAVGLIRATIGSMNEPANGERSS